MTMRFYEPDPTDPGWLATTAHFHGHLGPWLVVGALVGQDAVARLETRGHWHIDVTCYLPPERQRTPSTCMLDGLQATSGATMGKCNLHLDWAPEHVGFEWPVVVAIRLPRDNEPATGLHYHPRAALTNILTSIDPQQLEEIARDLARTDPQELFEIRLLTDSELTLFVKQDA